MFINGNIYIYCPSPPFQKKESTFSEKGKPQTPLSVHAPAPNNYKLKPNPYYHIHFQDFAINYWIDNGMPASKITLGIPLYGLTWTLSSNDTGLYAPASGPGAGGPYTNIEGFLGYNEVSCTFNTVWRIRRVF